LIDDGVRAGSPTHAPEKEEFDKATLPPAEQSRKRKKMKIPPQSTVVVTLKKKNRAGFLEASCHLAKPKPQNLPAAQIILSQKHRELRGNVRCRQEGPRFLFEHP